MNKPGMIQKELEIAKARLLLQEPFRYLTIRLDNEPLQDWMSPRQYINWDTHDLFHRIAKILNSLADDGNGRFKQFSDNVFVDTRPRAIKYETDVCDYQYTIPSVAIVGDSILSSELNSLIKGRVAEQILQMRGWVEGKPLRFSDIRNMVVLDLIMSENTSQGIGFAFEHFTHFSGAAHPNHGFLTLNIRKKPWGLFEPQLIGEDRESLALLIANEVKSIEGTWDAEMLMPSLIDFDWSDHFILTESGVRILFPDYVIGPYVFGDFVFETAAAEIVRYFAPADID